MIKTIDLQFQGSKQVIASYLMDSKEGCILVDPGPYSCFDILQSELKSQGVSLDDIKHVLLTHIHFDHAGASWALSEKGAKIYVHPFGAKHMIDPTKLVNSATMIYQDQMDTLWGKIRPVSETQICNMSDQEILKIGSHEITSYFTPGHARHHIAWKLENNLFTGDVAGVKIDQGPVVPPCPPPDINLEEWMESIESILSINSSQKLDKLYLTHFGIIQNPVGHLMELKASLNKWAEWIKPHFEQNTPVEEVVKLFDSFVVSDYSDLSDTQQKQYELANPNFMSVHGLLRYWRKKITHS